MLMFSLVFRKFLAMRNITLLIQCRCGPAMMSQQEACLKASYKSCLKGSKRFEFPVKSALSYCTEVPFSSFLSDGFSTMAVINPPERKMEKRPSVSSTIV